MIKILERGPPKDRNQYELVCKECDVVFEFQRDEVEFVSRQRGGDVLVIPCPKCRIRNRVLAHD